ncbi:MAG: hypothetical protein CSA70_04095 [Rhodobacterales bacterium]|nr:MAG: hypothetical protein CSA70_04095 [Rhodobacterales bacterium]
MKPLLSLVLTALIGVSAQAETQAEATLPEALLPSSEVTDPTDLSQFFWKNRVLVVFADSPNDPRYMEQLKRLSMRPQDLVDRDVVILLDSDPAAKSALREKLRPRGFMLMLLAKDGTVYLRKPLPWTTREISRSIDKLPLRQQELRDRPLNSE